MMQPPQQPQGPQEPQLIQTPDHLKPGRNTDGPLLSAERQEELAVLRQRYHNFDRLIAEQPGLQSLNAQAEPVKPEEEIVFAKENDEIASPLDIDLHAFGLPVELPAPGKPIALLLERGEADEVKAAKMILYDSLTTRLETLTLDDPDLPADGDELHLKWVIPGDTKLANNHASVNKSKIETDETIGLHAHWRGLTDDPAPNLAIVRGTLTQDETNLQDVAGAEKKQHRFNRLGKALAGVAVASLVSMFIPSHQTPVPERTFEKSVVIDHEHASKEELAVLKSFELYQNGDKEALDKIVAQSEFAKPLLEKDAVEQVEKATNLDELNSAMNDALNPLDINVHLLRESKTGEYDGLSDADFNNAKSTALGTLDGLSNLSELIRKGKKFNLELTKQVYGDEGEEHKQLGGVYIHGDEKNSPIIRLSSYAQRSSSAENVEHEEGHHEDLGKGFPNIDFLVVKPQDLKYGKDGSGNGRVGSDIPSEYAGTSYKEHMAEMFATAFGDNLKINPDENTSLQEEYKAWLSGLEGKYTGISAYVYSNALARQGPLSGVERVVNKADDAKDWWRRNSAVVLMGIVITGGFLAGARQKNQQLLERQANAGLRSGEQYSRI